MPGKWLKQGSLARESQGVEMEKPVLLKLGGSLITDKGKAETPNPAAIARLAKEIHDARMAGGFRLIVGHGGGSFPHQYAHKFQTQKGVSGKESYRGIALVQDAASRLNRIVVKALLDAGENAISVQPSACMVTEGGLITSGFLKPIERALDFDMVPVPYGDVAFDLKQGCSIISTERILSFVARKVGASRIIIAANEEGVWEDFPERKKLIEEITPRNFPAIKRHLQGSSDVDVTGGMLHKVERMLDLSNQTGADVVIVNGSVPGRLRDALLGKKVVGTVVRP